ncbi:MAG: ArsR/SmtB family transcription factor [Senegalia sp. (in: firmicutes)]|uniref:ArsR/SmtB family transcription factor n=1 Tax=Senegalia sp. (in: firmicutes) TaxID=1924098 RepID=UPI003F9622EA
MDIEALDLFNQKSEILKALAHPIRLCIVQGLMEEEGRNVTTIKNCLNTPQSTISQHLTKLKAAGIIEGKRNGTEINYYVKNEDAKNVINSILK